MSIRNPTEPNRSRPSIGDIDAALDEHKGVVYAQRTLSAKYGPPKGTWGPLFRQRVRQRSSNARRRAPVNPAVNASVNAQPNADYNAAMLNLGSRTGDALERWTPNVPAVVVREPDYIVRPYPQLSAQPMYPDAIDMVNFHLILTDPAFQQLTQRQWQPQPQCQPQPAAPPPVNNFWDDMNLMMQQIMQCAFQMNIGLAIFRSMFRN